MSQRPQRGLKRKNALAESFEDVYDTSFSRKRAKSNDDNDSDIRHSKYYKKDGDIIIKVGRTLFRVHIKRLEALGGRFKNMFSMDRPAQPPHIDGVPYCNLHDLVSSRDIEFLLALIYKDLALSGSTGKRVPWVHWDACVSLLHVSHRYDLHNLRLQVVDALKLLFPLSDKPVNYCPIIVGISDCHKRTVFKRVFAIQAIKLFREYDIPGLLPMAYYHAAQLPLEDILDGVKNSDDVVEKLPSKDRRIVILGREALKASRRTALFGWLADKVGHGQGFKGSAICFADPMPEFDDTCYGFFLRMYLDFHRHGFFDSTANSLEPLSKKGMDVLSTGVCPYCFMDCEKKIKEAVEMSWKEIPHMFGWTGWKDVMDAQSKVDSEFVP